MTKTLDPRDLRIAHEDLEAALYRLRELGETGDEIRERVEVILGPWWLDAPEEARHAR